MIPDKPLFQERLLEGLKLEWAQIYPLLKDKNTVSIYFGGGTPALFSEDSFVQLFEVLKKYLNLSTLEITLEANPETLTAQKLSFFRSLGINRLSIGVQTFDPALLEKIGRTHTADEAEKAIWMAFEAGFNNLSIDLMYDLPGQNLPSWKASLQKASALPLSHLSLYNLTIEPHTSFYKQRKALQPSLPDDTASFQMYQTAQEELEKGGLLQYEISAFAKPGFHSRHNSGYWLGRPFFGLGPSAFSFFNGKRFQNTPNLNRYWTELKEGRLPHHFSEELTGNSRLGELLMIGIRLKEGISLSSFEEKFGKIPPLFQTIFEHLENRGLIKQADNHLSLTPQGTLFYNQVAEELIII